MALNELLFKLRHKEAKVGIVGLGYVGLPLLMQYANAGFNVLGFDIDQFKIEKLLAHETYIQHFSNELIRAAMSDKADATLDFERASECDALIICVPTPLSKSREPDLTFITSTMDLLQPHLREGQIISLESTTWPGTTEEVVVPYLTAVGLVIGKNVFVSYSPEREDPGNENFNTRTIPKIVGGITPSCSEAGMALYKGCIETVVEVSSTKVAEMIKLLENIHRSVNIGLVNEMKIVADRMGIDIFEVIDGAATKPFGFTPYFSGPGVGGHCIPIDPFYLTWKAREFGINTRFIELAGEVNQSMPDYVVHKTSDVLNSNKKPLMGSKVLVLGVAYKKNVDDMRGSPSLEIIKILINKGAIVSYNDPHVPEIPKMRDYQINLQSIELTPENLSEQDVVIVATNHGSYNYDFIEKHAKLIVDTRGVYRSLNDSIVRG